MVVLPILSYTYRSTRGDLTILLSNLLRSHMLLDSDRIVGASLDAIMVSLQINEMSFA